MLTGRKQLKKEKEDFIVVLEFSTVSVILYSFEN